MKRRSMSFGFVVAVAVSIALISGGTAAAQTNTSYGTGALEHNTTGILNSAFGYDALHANTEGQTNTATGAGALQSNSSGESNTATGEIALLHNTTGSSNTATGYGAMEDNTTGNSNTATGDDSLSRNTIGRDNVATGNNALRLNTTGNYNTAAGYGALYTNTTGGQNVASGYRALYRNSTGIRNTGEGANALYSNTTGHYNIALGFNAGVNLTTGNYNIDIGSAGAAGEANAIRIGVQGIQTATFIAGISGTEMTGSEVVVNANGRLGVVMSSARYKHDIRDMGDASSRLLRLRPVTFKYKNDEHGITQYGLVAEEVEKVYPELVTYGADGKVETVRYSMLTGMLLNELQKQAGRIKAQDDRNARQAEQIRLLSAQMEQVTRKMSALEQAVKGNDTIARANK